MQCLVIYDISSDRIRGQIAELCLDYGLKRIQFSAFMGDLSGPHQTELYRRLQRALGSANGSIQIMPLDERSFSSRRLLGRAHEARRRQLLPEKEDHDGK